MLNLLLDYKTRILEARKGIFRDFTIEKIEIADASNFPGLLISSSIIGFLFVTLVVTISFTLISYPLFWRLVYSYGSVILTIIVSMAINELIDGYITDFAYEQLYCKSRRLAGIMDLVHFFLSILGGIGDSIVRVIKGQIGLMISLLMVHKPCVSEWVL